MCGPLERLLLVWSMAVLMCSVGCTERPARVVQPARRGESFTATAYCQRGLTATGIAVRDGIVAADPDVLPLGTRIRIAGLPGRYNREYRVMDTGRRVQGRHVDIYMRDCREAIRFGRRNAVVTTVGSGR